MCISYEINGWTVLLVYKIDLNSIACIGHVSELAQLILDVDSCCPLKAGRLITAT